MSDTRLMLNCVKVVVKESKLIKKFNTKKEILKFMYFTCKIFIASSGIKSNNEDDLSIK